MRKIEKPDWDNYAYEAGVEPNNKLELLLDNWFDEYINPINDALGNAEVMSGYKMPDGFKEKLLCWLEAYYNHNWEMSTKEQDALCALIKELKHGETD